MPIRGGRPPSTYAPLFCRSHYSFLEGASRPGELLERAAAFGIGSLCLADRDGVYGAVRAHVKARETGLHLVIGVQVSIVGWLFDPPPRRGRRGLRAPLPADLRRAAPLPEGRECRRVE